MKQPGRKSSAELSVASVMTSIKRVPPPKHLSDKSCDLWRMIMASGAAAMIQPEAYPVLVEYCRSIEQADIIAAEIDRCDSAWLKDDDGLKRYDKLMAMQERSTRIISSCAVKLRLTPSTRYHSETAARLTDKPSGASKPWDTKED